MPHLVVVIILGDEQTRRSCGNCGSSRCDNKGISVGGEETKLLQYADDMTAVLADVGSAQALFDLLEIFKNASCLTINFTKTEGMWIGSSKNNKAKPFGIK